MRFGRDPRLAMSVQGGLGHHPHPRRRRGGRGAWSRAPSSRTPTTLYRAHARTRENRGGLEGTPSPLAVIKVAGPGRGSTRAAACKAEAVDVGLSARLDSPDPQFNDSVDPHQLAVHDDGAPHEAGESILHSHGVHEGDAIKTAQNEIEPAPAGRTHRVRVRRQDSLAPHLGLRPLDVPGLVGEQGPYRSVTADQNTFCGG